MWEKSKRARLFGLLRLYACLALAQSLTRLIMGYLRRRRMARMLADVPHIRTSRHPLLGHIPSVVANVKRLHHWRDEATRGMPVSKALGPVWDTSLVVLMVRDPECIRHFLKDSFEKYTKGDSDDWFMRNMIAFLGKGIFTMQHGIGAPDKGELWVKTRKIAATIFSRKRFMKGMSEIFLAKAERVRNLLQAGQVIDMQSLAFKYTMDCSTQIFFGEESDTLGGFPNRYGTAFDTAQRAFIEYTFSSIGFVTLVRLLPWPFGGLSGLSTMLHRRCSPVSCDFRQALSIMDSESQRIIDGSLEDPKLESRTDLLALIMQDMAREGLSQRRSSRYLRDTISNFMIAGRDTTACTISWTLFILGSNPEIQRRVLEEIDAKLPLGTVPSLKRLQHSEMPALHALIYESLRLYPAVPMDGKTAQCDDVLPDGTQVPRSCQLLFLPWAMGRDPAVYPDPESVRLERWIPFKEPLPHEFPNFQAGPRICLGKDMAIFETKVLIATLLQSFSFTLAAGEEEKIHYSHTLTISVCNSRDQDSHNLWLIPESRARPVATQA